MNRSLRAAFLRAAAPSRLLESGVEAAFVLFLVLAAAGWYAPGGRLAVVAVAAFVVLAAAAYAFHVITFDVFRLIAHRRRTKIDTADVATHRRSQATTSRGVRTTR